MNAGGQGPSPDPALAHRIRLVNRREPNPDGAHVVHWMTSARRLGWNPALQRSVQWAVQLARPLVILEGIRTGYRWASDRHHRFCLDGMAEHARALAGTGVGYFPYVEPEDGAGRGLLEALAREAAVVVTDDFPSFFLPRMLKAAGARVKVRMEAVDSNGLLPLALPHRSFKTAQSFRRYLQKTLPDHLPEPPDPAPLDGAKIPQLDTLPLEVLERWPPAHGGRLDGGAAELAALPIDHSVAPVSLRGGSTAAGYRLQTFLENKLEGYAEGARHPDREQTSGLSPYLHWGHISSHEVVAAVLAREGWRVEDLSPEATGRRAGWWGVSSDAEAFLDQLVTWREMGYVTAWREPNHEEWGSLPEWARATLTNHAADPRPHLYGRVAFEEAQTHDPLWNAAQRQLKARGMIHNTLRMLWGKKILEWSSTPEEALETMLELNNRWGVDGRNPNSTSGIFWIMGRYDRGWPERPVFGTVRSMTSASTRRKVEVKDYLERFGG